MGPPLRSFAADAHDCIMVRVLGPTGYKVVARLIAPASGLPSDRHPDRTKRAVVLEAVKVWPSNGGACRKVGATANLDSFCARQRKRRAGRDEETALRSNKETDEGKDAPTCRPLKRCVLDKPHTRKPRLRDVTLCGRRYGDLGAAGELTDLNRAGATSCSTVKRLANERRVVSSSTNCRTSCGRWRTCGYALPWPVERRRA